MRWITRTGRGLLLAAIGIAGAFGLLQAQAPAAAACVGGIFYEDAVRDASGAIVGRVVAIAHDPVGFDYVTAVRVESAYGIAATGVFRHRANAGRICEDRPQVAARVVVLFDVPDGGDRPTRVDLFYTVGVSVTPGEVANVFRDLPDTATALEGRSGPPLIPWGLPALAGVVSFVRFLARPPRRARPARP